MLSLPSASDILALNFVFAPIKSYSYPINYSVFYQVIGKRTFYLNFLFLSLG